MVDWMKRHGLVLLAYLAVGVAVYWAALGAFFVSDDFEFLIIVASAKSWLVIFEPLVGRFVRPFVVLMYYTCYQLFGLVPWPYHVATLLPHLLNTALVYVVALRLFGCRFRSFLAGLLFLVFSAHSEDVAWPAGIADPIVAFFLLISFIYYLRARDDHAPARYLVISWLAVLGAVLTKEVWVSYPAILLTHAVVFDDGSPRTRRRAAILVVATGMTVVAYLAMRQVVFGSVTGGYSGLGTSFGTDGWLPQIHAFLVRCFVPAGNWAIRFWTLFNWIWPPVLAILAWRARGRDARVVAFTGIAMILALAPVLPLTISIATTESERFTYVATIFSCLLVVGAAGAVLRRRALVAAVCAVLIGWHAVVLRRNTTRWREAGEMARGIVYSLADNVRRYDPENRRPVFLLNLPDNLLGAYVYRRGFYPAVELFTPDVGRRTAPTVVIATNSFGRRDSVTRARQAGPNTFTLGVGPGRYLQDPIPSGVSYRIVEQAPTRYTVSFADSISSGLVLHTSAGRVEYTGTIEGAGAPFGTIDIPAESASCDGATVRFSGWALDDVAVARVSVAAVGGDGIEEPIGDATFSAGTRPDVARIFSWWPHHDRAEWNYHLPCPGAAQAPGGAVRIRVTAIDDAGHRTELGTRLVKARQP